MAEKPHILDDLVERINKETGEEITVYLAIDENDVEFLFFKTEHVERGIPLDSVSHTYGRFRLFSEESEEDAIKALTSALSESIKNQVEELTKAAQEAQEADKED